MIVNNINPVLFKLGFLEIRYYGIIYAMGFIIAYLFLRGYIKKGILKGMSVEKLEDLIFYLILGVVIGARIFNFIFYEPVAFLNDPLKILKIWEGGLSFHGGLIGAIVSIYLFSMKNKIKILTILDSLVVPASLALALGRIANFTNHELYGTVTNATWCVEFLTAYGCRHPYQIYASISHLVMFVILIFVYKKQKKEGTTFFSFVLIYGLFRIFTDIWRAEDKIFIGVLSTGQMLSVIMVIAGGIILLRSKTKS
jgi:phosphatidylglycerol---prolipoprotein diacylglyceryl transferase